MSWKFFRGKRDPVYDEILDRIKAYDNSDHKSLIHARLDERTAANLSQLKLATGVEIQKIVAFSISELLRQHPELKTIIKNFLATIN